MTRPDWDLYFIRIAKEVASRSTCKRAAVGAVITRNNRILATGYNGAPEGEQHCTEVGCDVVDGHCVRVIHAEENAIIQAREYGISLEGATLYYWDSAGRYAQTTEAFSAQFPKYGAIVKAVGITRVCGRGL